MNLYHLMSTLFEIVFARRLDALEAAYRALPAEQQQVIATWIQTAAKEARS